MSLSPDDADWFSVRCLFYLPDHSAYEERITLWCAENFAEAIALAESEALEYASLLGIQYVGLAQAYALSTDPESGAEVFSLVRGSGLSPNDYLNHFFDTGTEFQRPVGPTGHRVEP